MKFCRKLTDKHDLGSGGENRSHGNDPQLGFPTAYGRRCLPSWHGHHVCPLTSNDGWRQNVRQLLRRQDAFNGKRVAAIACGPGLEPPSAVRRAFAGSRFEFLELPNDPQLREVVSFLPLLLSACNPSPHEATFYAHTKGNSTAENRLGAIYWRNAAYHHLLDRWPECMAALGGHACCGIHKMVWPPDARSPYPTGLRHGQWMFAGTFFWFRNDAVFSHAAWRQVPMDRYGAEAWLAGLFAPHQATSMYQRWPEHESPSQSVYDPALYDNPIDDEPLGKVARSPEIDRRGQFAALCAARGLTGAACEVGVHRGDFAQEFLDQWPGREYFAIDNYLPHPDVPGDRAEHRQFAHNRLAVHAPRLRWLHSDSLEGLGKLAPLSLDFCYIDASHGYEQVGAEIAAAWPLVRSGGILAGHDFGPDFPGVTRAVREFSEDERITIWLTEDFDGPWSWYCIKT